ncbi:hypothetical protein GQ55_7G230000 [Panicum hallii var. hallii]|uniref:Uncharacterized protein n=1 Tax=Panicum hallii var. hallii TaxID=1504633 RepID=A0A2T7CY17_9POAL|nr:hypothetical protein GQ55_7G230000 [Panicum hallii var. hallii]
MARRGALPSSGPCRAPCRRDTHAALDDGRMQPDECARGPGARPWPGFRACVGESAGAADTAGEIPEDFRWWPWHTGPRSPPPGGGLSGEANRRDRPRSSRREAGTGAYHHAGLGQNASGTGLATARALWPDAAADPKAGRQPNHWPPPTSPGSGVRGG